MDASNTFQQMLNLISQPAFTVGDGHILLANREARQLLLVPGTELAPMLEACEEDYSRFQSGCLYLPLTLGGQVYHARAVRIEDRELFILDRDADPQLQAMALAAQKLRSILSDTVTAADRLLPQVPEQAKEQAAQLTRGLYQLMRNLGNMSDADKYAHRSMPQATVEADSFFREILEKAGALLTPKQVTLSYSGLPGGLYCLMQQELMERAVYNLISNAVRHTPPGGLLRAELVRNGSRLSFSLEDSGSGTRDLSTVLSGCLRTPGVEDGSKGIGLGMLLVREAAAAHGGTVLIEQPKGLKITVTIPIHQGNSQVRSPFFRIDYAGELDHGLIELSDVLPWESFQ